MKITEKILRQIIKEEIENPENLDIYACGHCDNGIRNGSHSDEKMETYCDCEAGRLKKKENAIMRNSFSDIEKYDHQRY